MIRVSWVTSPGEAEFDMSLLQSDRLALRVWPIGADSSSLIYPNWEPVRESDLPSFLRRIAATPADLIVFRSPFWIFPFVGWDVFWSIFRGLPILAWMSEQGPVLDRALNLAAMFDRVGVNNRLEMTTAYPQLGKKLYYLPFGCVPLPPAEPEERFSAELMADSNAHYACGDEDRTKRESVDVMIRPWFGRSRNLALRGGVDEVHGWLGVPGAQPYWRGEYGWRDTPIVYASSKVYLGISWNWRHGGYGVKLARALGFGAATIWHKTVGMELDGLEHGKQLLAASTPEECVEMGEWLLTHDEERTRLAKAGQDWAFKNWSWEENLIRVAKEVNS